ncbi:cytochrome P450 [Boletus edulis BED1]|uniref:Cytochrome P450 n=1 Tax=Boletus edulis BED1 TaxID=1328754 RepID=A0AAD4BTB9_BOLED|nr:cytochrome P450 [Boletus edulis BED1]
MELTPGMHYIGRCMVSVVFPIVGLFLLLQRLLAYAGIPLSTGGSVALLVAIFLAVLAVYIVSIEISQRRRAAALGARLVPRIQGYLPGNMDMLLHMIGRTETDYIGTALLEQIRLYGPVINLRFFWEDVFLTIEPQNIKASLRSILATDFNSYVKGDKFKETADSLLGTGVFNSDGELSMLHRSMARPFFSIDRISHFDIFDRHAETTIALMKERFRAGLAVDFQDAVSRFTLDSASEFLFGHCIDTLAAGLPYPYNFSRPGVVSQDSKNVALDFASAFAAAQQAMTRRNLVGGTWPLWELFRDPLKEPMKVVNAFLDPILKDAIAKQKASQGLPDADKDAEDETLLDHLMRQTTDIKILKDQTLNILLAGRDTTASTLMSAIYLLATHPDVLRRLREEILKKVGPTRRPSYDDIRGMKFLRAVLNETLRLFPAVESANDTIWQPSNPTEKPLFVPAGTIVSYSVLLMQRRTDLWGPDALEFDPDRFLDDRLRKYLTPNPFIFLPFNAGPRICLGQQFAYNEMSFMLIRLLQHFSSITLSPESQDPQYRPPAAWARGEGRQVIEKFHPRHHLTLYAKGGLWVKMEPAEM